MATDRKSILEMYDAYCSRCNERQMFTSTLDRVVSEHNFDSVKSCLAIGAGEGIYEMGFMSTDAPQTSRSSLPLTKTGIR